MLFSIFVLLFVSSQIRRTWFSIGAEDDCQLSLIESDEFFCESDTDWFRRKVLFSRQHRENRLNNSSIQIYPTFTCQFQERLAAEWICDAYRVKDSSSCLIYSIISDEEFQFENEMKSNFPHCQIHRFDQEQRVCPESCTYHQVGTGNGKNQTKSLATLIKEVGLSDGTIDVLKIDLRDLQDHLLNDLNKLKIRQILIRLDLPKTPDAIERFHRLFQFFHDEHYVIFHQETSINDLPPTLHYNFIRLNEKFFHFSNNSLL